MGSNGPFGDDEATPVHVMHPHPTNPKPVPQAFLDRAYAFTAPFEGNFNHMYLDSSGLVTVGVGCLLTSPREAAKLPFIPSTEVVSDFNNVASKPTGHVAGWYKQFTRCVLPPAAIRTEFNRRAVDFVTSLRRIVPSYDVLPESAQLGLFDIIFNVGAGDFSTGWHKLKAGIAAQDYITSANESRRAPPVSASRNLAVGKLFIDAHRQAFGNA